MLNEENLNAEVKERVPGPEDPKLGEETDLKAKIYNAGERGHLQQGSAEG